MPYFSSRRFVSYSAAQMFALVADVEQYPKFLFMCEDLIIRERAIQPDCKVLVTDMVVGYKFAHEKFTTKVFLYEKEKKIEVCYIDGPFKHLENRWQFIDQAEGGCLIDFFITYDFKSKFLSLLMGSMFESTFSKFTSSFVERAQLLYSSPEVPLHINSLNKSSL